MSHPYRHTIALLLLAALLWPVRSSAQTDWQSVEAGLDIATIPLAADDASGIADDGEDALTILRIDPKHYEFVVLAATERGRLLTPQQWADEYHLTAVINASMYLPDHRTSTGYLRNDSHLNNDYVNKRFGSFFVAYPYASGASASLPEVTILDRQADDWENLIGRYRIVVQNFRMINVAGTPLWPEQGEAFSIAAVAMDAAGNILFIHCRPPLTVRQFTDRLMTLDLSIKRAMYVEGGPQASLHLHAAGGSQTWSGRHDGDFWSGAHVEWQLPNALGIRRK